MEDLSNPGKPVRSISVSGRPALSRADSIRISVPVGKKRLLILGGGYAGAKLARLLQKESLNFDVVLIDSKTYFENTISVLRLVSTTDTKDQLLLTKELLVKHEDYLRDIKFINQKVVAVAADKVITEEDSYYFDYLVICTGSSYPLIKQTGESEFRLKTLRDQIKFVQEAATIVVIGGGYVGVELASELAVAYPKAKSIILIQRADRLLVRGGSSLSKKALKILLKQGVRVMLNSSVTNLEEAVDVGYCVVRNSLSGEDTRIPADKIFNAAGPVPNSQFMQKFLSYCLNDKGQITVNEHFQLLKNSNIFAVGDVSSIAEEKVAERAGRHIDFLMKQLRKISEGAEDTLTGTQYSELGISLMQVTSLGPKEAICTYGKTVVTTGSLGASSKKLIFNSMMKVTLGQSTTEKIIQKNQQLVQINQQSPLSDSQKPKERYKLVLLGVEETRFGRDLVQFFLNENVSLCVAVTTFQADAMARKQNLFLENVKKSRFGTVAQYKDFNDLAKLIEPATNIILSTPLVNHLNFLPRISDLLNAVKALTGESQRKLISFLHPYACDLGINPATANDTKKGILRDSFLICEKLLMNLSLELPSASYCIIRFSGDYESIMKYMNVNKNAWSYPLDAYQNFNYLSRFDLFSALKKLTIDVENQQVNAIFMFNGPQRHNLGSIQNVIRKATHSEIEINSSNGNLEEHFRQFCKKNTASKFCELNEKQCQALREAFEKPQSMFAEGNELQVILGRSLETFAEWIPHNLHHFMSFVSG